MLYLIFVLIACFALFLWCILSPRTAFPIVSLAFGGIVLASCAQLGISQSEDEALYTTGATAADVAMLLGKGSPDQYCRGDTVAYSILITSRNPADGVKSYAPADNAHAKLQNGGVKLGGDCSAVAPTTP